MGETVDTIPSILNKCLFVSPDRQTDGRTDGRPGKNNMSLIPSGGDINIVRPIIILSAFNTDLNFLERECMIQSTCVLSPDFKIRNIYVCACKKLFVKRYKLRLNHLSKFKADNNDNMFAKRHM